MTTGERIRAARKKAHLTQKELGRRMGLSPQSVAQWENDLRNPKIETIRALAKALEISERDLLDPLAYEYGVSHGIELETWGNQMVEDALAAEGYTYSELEFALISAFSRLNEKGQQVAIDRLQELTEIPRYRADHVQNDESTKK